MKKITSYQKLKIERDEAIRVCNKMYERIDLAKRKAGFNKNMVSCTPLMGNEERCIPDDVNYFKDIIKNL